jgi:large subunit ribosomal protein L7Ae
LSSYRPETRKAKTARLTAAASKEKDGKKADPKEKPKTLKFGLNHITQLVENKEAKLVVIAHDVDPIELVVWLPTLCRKMDVPFCIVKGKARLGHLVHKKTCSVVALTEVNNEHKQKLQLLQDTFRAQYHDPARTGDGVLGFKAQQRQKKIAKILANDAKRANKMI